MIRILIVDDEVDAREYIRTLLGRIGYQENIYEAHSVGDALEKVNKISFDLVLLDIHLNDGSGFDILSQSKNPEYSVIFITAFDKYAIRAFKFHAFDYLLKPIDIDELKHSIQSLLNQQRGLRGRLTEHIEEGGDMPKKIALPYQSGFIYVSLHSITYLEADGSYTVIHVDGKSYVASKRLKHFEELLTSDGFCRIHASYLINLSRLISFSKKNGGEVELDEGTVLSVSRSRRNRFITTIEKGRNIKGNNLT